jgi:AcrR family transcriptional regulator
MRQSGTREAAARGSAEGWLTGAYEALIESGVDAVRISVLSERLNLSRTSFYWFFQDRDALLAALIERWRANNTYNFIGRTEAYAESIEEATFNVFDCWLDSKLFDSRFEFAMRNWAQSSEDVRAQIDRADTARIAALKNMFIRFDYDQMSADVRARTTYLTQIGYISMKTREDLTTRMARIPHYVEIFTGRAPAKASMERFFARHTRAGRK